VIVQGMYPDLPEFLAAGPKKERSRGFARRV
jgi:hypothetical protein